jgi:hypothetical protein
MKQSSDITAYHAVDALIHGADPAQYVDAPPLTFGNWDVEVRAIVWAGIDNGVEGALFRYISIVYHNPKFAQLMATLGFQRPKVHWQPHEMPTCPPPRQMDTTEPPVQEPVAQEPVAQRPAHKEMTLRELLALPPRGDDMDDDVDDDVDDEPSIQRPPRLEKPKRSGPWNAVDALSGRYDARPVNRFAGREDEVWQALQELGEATVAQIAERTGQDRSNVHRRLKRLCEMGQAVRAKTAGGVLYRKKG